jgi:hypothetical protein
VVLTQPAERASSFFSVILLCVLAGDFARFLMSAANESHRARNLNRTGTSSSARARISRRLQEPNSQQLAQAAIGGFAQPNVRFSVEGDRDAANEGSGCIGTYG